MKACPRIRLPPRKGMALVFADDFKRPLSISSTDPKATYYDHKPPGGWQDFSTLRFTSFDHPIIPFARWIPICASGPAKAPRAPA